MIDLELTSRGTTLLGSLIDTLEKCGRDQTVRFDFCYLAPTTLASYRGYYEDLALGWTSEFTGWPTVEDLLVKLREAIGKTYTGWKGGDYVMGRESSVWVANRGESGGTGIVAVSNDTYHGVVLVTALVD